MIFEYKARNTVKPLLNESSWMFSNVQRGVYNTQPLDYHGFVKMVKSTPEAIGITRAMVTDILSDGVVWKGKSFKVKKAKDWCSRKQLFTKKLPEGLYDWFFFGNNLIWTGMTTNQAKEMVLKEFSGLELKEQKQQELVGEIVEAGLDYRNVPWSTVTIDSDATDITGFSQNMSVQGVKSRSWKADEVIHATLMNLDGKAYGFSPMIASTSVISTLALIKDYNGYKFDNGGEPDFIFSFPQEIADNPNVKALIRHLQEKKLSRNKGGSIVMTGEVDITPVNTMDRDMEYRLLAVYYTGILAFSFNMPIGRIQSILGSEVKVGSQDLSDAGYWRSVSHMQSYWEELLNRHVFEPNFGVTFEFKRSYKQDEVREAQVMQIKASAITAMITGLKLKPSRDYLKCAFGFDDDDIDWSWYDKLDPTKMSAPKGDGSPPSNTELLSSGGKVDADAKKRDAMNSRVNVP